MHKGILRKERGWGLVRSKGVGLAQSDRREIENMNVGAGGWSMSQFPFLCFCFLSEIKGKHMIES